MDEIGGPPLTFGQQILRVSSNHRQNMKKETNTVHRGIIRQKSYERARNSPGSRHEKLQFNKWDYFPRIHPKVCSYTKHWVL